MPNELTEATRLKQEHVTLLMSQQLRCEECNYESFIQVGSVTRCAQCRKVTVTRQSQSQDMVERNKTTDEWGSPSQTITEPGTPLPLNTYEAQDPHAITGLDRVLDNTHKDNITAINGLSKSAVTVLMDFFHEFNDCVSRPHTLCHK